MQAFACEVPVICTKTGNTAELLSQYNAGCLLEIDDYKEWEKKFEAILNNKLKVYPLNRFVAQQHYDWPNIARKFINIYDELTKRYFDVQNGQIR